MLAALFLSFHLHQDLGIPDLIKTVNLPVQQELSKRTCRAASRSHIADSVRNTGGSLSEPNTSQESREFSNQKMLYSEPSTQRIRPSTSQLAQLMINSTRIRSRLKPARGTLLQLLGIQIPSKLQDIYLNHMSELYGMRPPPSYLLPLNSSTGGKRFQFSFSVICSAARPCRRQTLGMRKKWMRIDPGFRRIFMFDLPVPFALIF
ncbi:hypothetical protein RRG08_057209 [Elysia crispata]|uniref:Uncharacterized protein n=1 Tax=Elysia crispata TaxID=231223 RepID=A0AAE1CNC7_9GAST|nr:hypothetical protein RRG08_057209 [Elysia crispata]